VDIGQAQQVMTMQASLNSTAASGAPLLAMVQVLSDSNGDFAVIGICSADAAASTAVAALGSQLSGQQQQGAAAAATAAASPGSLQGLRMHVSATLIAAAADMPLVNSGTAM
jgi:hypothetical protein